MDNVDVVKEELKKKKKEQDEIKKQID